MPCLLCKLWVDDKSERTTTNNYNRYLGGKHSNFFLSSYVTTWLILNPTFMQECVSATGLTDTTPTDEKLADIRECCRRVGTTFLTCRRQTKMSVVWGVKMTDTNPDIASQGGEGRRDTLDCSQQRRGNHQVRREKQALPHRWTCREKGRKGRKDTKGGKTWREEMW